MVHTFFKELNETNTSFQCTIVHIYKAYVKTVFTNLIRTLLYKSFVVLDICYLIGYWNFNPSNAEATFVQSTRSQGCSDF